MTNADLPAEVLQRKAVVYARRGSVLSHRPTILLLKLPR